MLLLDNLMLLVAGHFATALRFHASLSETEPIHAAMLYFSVAPGFFLSRSLICMLHGANARSASCVFDSPSRGHWCY